MPSLFFNKRQSYGGVTTGITHAGTAAASEAKQATSSLSRNEIIGVVVGILALTVLVIGSIWWCCVRSAKRRDAAHEEESARVRERLQKELSSSTVDMRSANAHDRLLDRRGSERTFEEDDLGRQPLREADSRASEFQGNEFLQDYRISSQGHRYTSMPIHSPMREHYPAPPYPHAR